VDLNFHFLVMHIPGLPPQRMRSDRILNCHQWGCTGRISTRIYRSADCYEIIPNAKNQKTKEEVVLVIEESDDFEYTGQFKFTSEWPQKAEPDNPSADIPLSNQIQRGTPNKPLPLPALVPKYPTMRKFALIFFLPVLCFVTLGQEVVEEPGIILTTPAGYLRMAAEQGDAKAQFDLGRLYSEGNGVRKDNAEAAKWIRKAAEQGHAMAQFHLAAMHF